MSANYLKPATLSRTRRLLSWPSGIIPEILVRCPAEQNYYCGLGTLVWFNSMLAGCGMALMLSQTSSAPIYTILGGAFWFLCVVNLDRFMLLTNYENAGWKKLMPVARILLSLCLAIIIGEHVVQYLFHNEINNQLAQEKLSAQRANYEKALEGFPEIAALNDEKNRKQAEIDKIKGEASRLRADYISEAEGSTGSRIRGKGPLFEQKERDYKAALAEKQKLETELQEIQGRLDAKTKELAAVVKVANDAKDRDKGFLSYHRALMEIIRHDRTLLFLYLVISAAMILFEVTPLFSKLSGKVRRHDFLIGKEVEVNQREEARRYEDRLRNLKRETENAASLAEKINQLKQDTLDEVTEAIRSNAPVNLNPEKVALAESLSARVYGDIRSQIKQGDVGHKSASHDQGFAAAPAQGSPVSVTGIIRESEDEQPFTIVFQQPREKIQGRDLLYALAGLEQSRPSGAQSRLPLHQYRITNDLGELIQPDRPLFPQINGSRTVYLSPLELVVNET